MKHIEDYAKERMEEQLCKDVKGMNYTQREKYLSSVARLIEDMLKDDLREYGNFLGVDNDLMEANGE